HEASKRKDVALLYREAECELRGVCAITQRPGEGFGKKQKRLCVQRVSDKVGRRSGGWASDAAGSRGYARDKVEFRRPRYGDVEGCRKVRIALPTERFDRV